MHLVDKHHFPKYYDFFVVIDGMDQRQSMLRPEYQSEPIQSKTSSKDSSLVLSSKHQESPITKADQRRPDSKAAADPRDEDCPLEERTSNIKSNATGTDDIAMKDISGAMSSLRLVPTSVQFGNAKRAQGFSKR